MKTIMFTQRREDFGKYKPVSVPFAFRDWLYRLNRKDKLPRGKYFKGKVGGKPMIFMDEFWHFINPNLMRSTHHLFKDNMINVIDKPITPLESIREYLRGDTYSREDSLLIPTQEQIELWRKATGNEGGIAEYQQWILATCNHTKK